jgi:hypothetical protein
MQRWSISMPLRCVPASTHGTEKCDMLLMSMLLLLPLLLLMLHGASPAALANSGTSFPSMPVPLLNANSMPRGLRFVAALLQERFEQLRAAAAKELQARDADRDCLLAATHGLLDMRDADLGRLRAELAAANAELADSRARESRRDAQLAALAQGDFSALGRSSRGLVAELIRAAGTLMRQRALYRTAFGAAQLELNYRVGAVPECELPVERSQRLARLQAAASAVVADIQRVRCVPNLNFAMRAHKHPCGACPCSCCLQQLQCHDRRCQTLLPCRRSSRAHSC